ncbi:MAG: YegS/Rv2252/BmrU family lipid kinase [Wenzhouxiangellaceae bacterium]
MEAASQFTRIVLYRNPRAGRGGHDPATGLARVGLCPELQIDRLETVQEQRWGLDELLVIAGGDGTVNEVVSRLLDRKPRPVIAVLPCGTANDFARSLGLPQDLAAACDRLAQSVIREVDAARINDQILLNAAHIGLGAVISGREAGDYKGAWGRLSYLRGLLARLGDGIALKATVTIADDSGGTDRCFTHRWRNITIANGHYFGGGHTIGAEAILDDGLLDVLAVRYRPVWRVVAAELGRRFGFRTVEAVRHWRTRRVSVDTDGAHPVTVDGDIRTRTPLHAETHARALRVLAPAGTVPGLQSPKVQGKAQ